MNEKKKNAKRVLTPREARTDQQICDLPRDNVSTRRYWIMLSGEGVVIAKQTRGEPCESSMMIPLRDFHRLIDWYNTGRWGTRANPTPATSAKRRSRKSAKARP